jgi:hypothetical protein
MVRVWIWCNMLNRKNTRHMPMPNAAAIAGLSLALDGSGGTISGGRHD